MKKIITAFLLIILFISFTTYSISSEEEWTNPFSDVNKTDWFYTAASAIGYNNFLPDKFLFEHSRDITRKEMAFALYSLADFRGMANDEATYDFADLDKKSEIYVPASWCVENSVLSCSENLFYPDKNITKEEFCTILTSFVRALDLSLIQKREPSQFIDSLLVSKQHRSAVVACKMAGIVNGYGNGYLHPEKTVCKREFASSLYALMPQMSENAKEAVDLSTGAYDSLYDGFAPVPEKDFNPFVMESSPVSDSFFDNAVFIGDSISVKLQFYNKETSALGNAKFLCAESLSPMSALKDVSDESIHPSFRGKKVKPADGVLMSGAQKVYIMLGMNGIAIDFNRSFESTKMLIEEILLKSPESVIFVQSVTPITFKSSRADEDLNVNSINAYNEQLSRICSENGWYYLDVASALKDENGYLKSAFCSDDTGMGIHFNDVGADIWVNYLKTHIPPGLN